MQTGTKYQKRNYYLEILQWVIFAFLIFTCYLLETSGSNVKPLLLLPLGLCISSHTGELRSMGVGTVCGLLLDLACGKLPGFNAILMVLFCVFCSLLYHYLLKQKLLNLLFLTAVFTMIQAGLDYFFYYAIWGYADVNLIWENFIFPSCGMTIISTLPFYFLIGFIARKCGSHRTDTLEKTNMFSYQE